jgi:NAD(P)H dehydrogenase (quinone)
MKKILVISGHPGRKSLCHDLAETYAEAARAKNQVKFLDVRKLKFDPMLREGYGGKQRLEKDLVKAQKLISWADHLVISYPTWWGMMPAMLKGFFERILLPGFAFKYKEGGRWDKLLEGRSARVLVTMDAPYIFYCLMFGKPGHRLIKNALFGFCGISPVKFTNFTMVRHASKSRIEGFFSKAKDLGQEGI